MPKEKKAFFYGGTRGERMAVRKASALGRDARIVTVERAEAAGIKVPQAAENTGGPVTHVVVYNPK